MHKINFHDSTYKIEKVNLPITQFEDLLVYVHKMVLKSKYRPYDDYEGMEDVFDEISSSSSDDQVSESLSSSFRT